MIKVLLHQISGDGWAQRTVNKRKELYYLWRDNIAGL